MDIFQAIVLAIVQGITEFLPISSSAHLILVPELLGWPDQGLAFDVAVHVGTLLAVIALLRRELQQIIPAWLRGWNGFRWGPDGQLGWMVILATVPVGLIGLVGVHWIEANLRSPLVIAASTGLFALLLWWSDRHAGANRKTLGILTWRNAALVGLAQAFALIPGTSRSGVTMTAMLALGYHRVDAARFSFLLAVPTIALPGLLKARELAVSIQPVAWSSIVIGVVVSAVVAFLCMRWFLSVIEKVGMLPFVIYRLLLALVIVLIVS